MISQKLNEYDIEKTKDRDFHENMKNVKNYLVYKCGSIPLLGKRLIGEMNELLQENEKDERTK